MRAEELVAPQHPLEELRHKSLHVLPVRNGIYHGIAVLNALGQS